MSGIRIRCETMTAPDNDLQWQSPFLHVQHDTRATLLQTSRTPSDNGFMVQIIRSLPKSEQLVNSMQEAEDRFLSQARRVQEEEHVFAFRLNAQSAYVATATRRGLGNIWLLHPDRARMLPNGFFYEMSTGDFTLTPNACQKGRWWFYGGTPNKTIWCSSHLRENQAYVIYHHDKSQYVDGAAVVLYNQQQYYLVIPETLTTESICSVSNYVTEITFV